MQVLAEPPMAQKYLKTHMASIKDSASQCYNTSREIDNEFNKWLLFVQELNTACTEQKSSAVEKAVANELKKATEECRLLMTEETVTEAKRTTEQLGKTLDAATVAYTKASDSFPSGWVSSKRSWQQNLTVQ
jgi:tyrosyl-tRNA synthetase